MNVIIVAHRGFSGIYPENTLLAFEKAIEIGADFLELDIHQAKDGNIVVCHDATIDRTTTGCGYIKEMDYSELLKWDAGSWKGYPGEKIPLLSDVFQRVGNRIGIFIEIKECNVPDLVSLIKDFKMEKRIVVGSFNLEYIKQVRNLCGEISTALISSRMPKDLDSLIKFGIRQLSIEFHQLDKRIVKELVSRGFVVNAWTPDSEEDLKRCLTFGVQFLTTNRPHILKEKIQREEGN
ncbi:glycerophosphodiester phosphodiesterase [bacterium]|nr:glycerophosphodiester phosphodiesterase [bacterium]